jgi:hypothetical protein
MSDPRSAYVHRSILVDGDGGYAEGVNKIASYVWDTSTLAWVKATPSQSGGTVSVSGIVDVSPNDKYSYTYTWNSDGTPATKTRTYSGVSQTKTYTWSSGNLVSQSGWV